MERSKKHRHNESMGTIMIRDVDEELRKKFRRICFEANISMNKAIKDWISRVVQEGKLK